MATYHESREADKERLRKNIISNNNVGKDAGRPSPVVFIVGLIVVIGLIFGVYWSRNMSLSTGYTVSWERSTEGDEQTVETFRDYVSFAGGIIKYTKDGAEFIDSKGNVVWERSYQLNSPVIDTCDKYAVIGDRGGTDLYIFDNTTMTGSSHTLLPISMLRAADNGVVYAVLNDSAAEYISAFKSDGSAIDLSVKSVIGGDGYPFDIDVSPDGTELISSYLSIDNGRLVNNVVFRNFGSIGQNEDARRVVGGFSEEFAGHLAGFVNFSSNEFSQAFYDGGVVFFSTEVLNSPEIINTEVFEDKIESVVCSDSIEAVITSSESSDTTDKLLIYDLKGNKTGEADLDYKHRDICVSNNTVMLLSDNEIRAYGKNGVLRGDFSFAEGEVTGIVGGGSDSSIYIITATNMYRVRF